MNSKLDNLEEAVSSLESTIETSTNEIKGYGLTDLSEIKSEQENMSEIMNSKLNNLEAALNSLESAVEASTSEIKGYSLTDLSDIKSELEDIKFACQSLD